MSKQFCPRCGHPTLMRAASSTCAITGELTVYLRANFQYRLRGTRYSRAAPRGGHHHKARNLILAGDQKEYRTAVRELRSAQRQAARQSGANDLSNPDYMPSIMTGASGRTLAGASGNVTIGMGRRNPNQARRLLGKKKKH
ncbi:hypothetical protein H696_04597 [Fonticula alba]|uniref:Nin one binding (NOB1) Zn-ribbon-like domain-containing protein n=1 Tax=Fonticula alba TaxID=691883 RepID=A0A058Z4X2_FONAL|nr:hypothetical protein H696_04597 [Fonticula alba]KCV69186.1 hypothetical protein H696_04597 [Fonticula alba]|eukprot:XP_009496757.1 hypothetical protein H696_04597 [Fonticula alba]